MHKKILQILIFIIPLFYVFHYVISYSGKLVNNAEKVKNNLVINELLADNIGGLKDENGNYSDWIELYNPTDENVNLEGFAIGNQRNINKAFKLPPTDIPANGYLVIFADGQDYIDDNIHLNFLLNKSGESVYLFDPNGEVIDEMTYPSLEVNISYGRSFNNMNEEGIFTFATPGSLNTSSFIKQREIKDIGTVLFSMSGGNYDEEFYLELSSVVPNAIILFTLDGSEPTPENAEVYTEPIRITSTESIPNKYVTQRCIPDTDANQDFHNYLYTYGVNNVKKGTVIRARLYLNGILSEKIETETYYINTDYSLPVVSIVTDPDDLFGNEEGSYVLGSAYYAASRLNIGVETLGNYYIDKKIDAHIEIWDVNGEKIIDDDIELKQGGAYSRMYSIQKSFNINLLNSKISFKSESSSNEYSYSDFALKGTGG